MKISTKSSVLEDVPVNNVSGGNIAGAGVGAQGEPGVSKKRKKLPGFKSYISMLTRKKPT